ncbi:hypothetical protein GCM10010441_55830 [Kitasatospora paracochleata]|uniref:LamG-like jellyroll fold domain-containing protein n=1 Tax=Kitasatospora paracochleata TaxID=58354 RepID=A0ABT1J6J4_9ACTN|nr:LamG domain-containing protein [Kitasatospora paracochleata]MCP2313059.1 hypothetical protein [Kitasatospora paracochleata]
MNIGGGANTQSETGGPQGPGAPQTPPGQGWGAPAYLPPVTSAAPDWAALAAENERQHKRRRMLRIGGAAAAVVVVGALVATAIAVAGPDHGKPVAGPSVDRSANPDGPATPDPGAASPAASASASGSPSASPTGTPDASASGKPTAGKPGSSATPGAGAQPAPGLPGLTLANGAAVGPTDGHTGPTLITRAANGDGYAQSPGPLVDTSKSFTVSAVVRNNAPSGGRAIITQGSEGYYSFYLGRDYWDTHNQWVFKIQSAAGNDDHNVRQAFSTAPATTGQWLLLTGVYDATAKKISLYVNGVLQQTTSIPGIWQTNGPTQIGRTKYKGTWTDYWDGSIADVQIWNQALPAGSVSQLQASGGASAGTPAAHSWLLP